MCIIDKIKAYLPTLRGVRPDYNLKSVYDINLDELQSRGISGIFFDLDSTITISKSAKFSPKMREFLNEIKSRGIKIAILSNNYSDKYVARVQNEIDIKIYYPAQKPQTKMLERVMEELGLNNTNTVMVGDRPLTDIQAGINAGMMTILVDGIDVDNENPPTRLIRRIERLVIKK